MGVKIMSEIDAIGKVAGKAAEKGAVAKIAGKVLPGANIAIGAVDAAKAIKAGKYGTAAVAGAEAVPGPVGWAAMGADMLGAGKVADKAVNSVGKTVNEAKKAVTSKDGMKALKTVGAMTLPGAMLVGAGSIAHAMTKHNQRPDVQMTKESVDSKTGLPTSINKAQELEANNPNAKIKTKAEQEKYQKQADAYNKQADSINRHNGMLKTLTPPPHRDHVTAQDMKYRDMMERDRQKGQTKDKNKDKEKDVVTPLTGQVHRGVTGTKTLDSISSQMRQQDVGRDVRSEPIDPKTGLPLSVARARESEKDNPDAKLTAKDRPKFEQEAKAANENLTAGDKKVTAQDMKYRETAKVNELNQNDPTKKDSVIQLTNQKLDQNTGKPQALSLANRVEANNPQAKLTPQDQQQYQSQADRLNNDQNYQGQKVTAQEMKNFDTFKADLHNAKMSEAKAEPFDKNNGIAMYAKQQDQIKASSQASNNVSQDKTMTKDAKTQDNVSDNSEDKDKSSGLGKLAIGGGLAAGGAALGSKLMSGFKGMQTGLNKNGKSLQQTMGKMTGDMQKGSQESQAKLQKDMAKMGVNAKGDAKQQASSESQPSVG